MRARVRTQLGLRPTGNDTTGRNLKAGGTRVRINVDVAGPTDGMGEAVGGENARAAGRFESTYQISDNSV